MNRTARFDFDPMARPAPITCCSVATHHYPTPDERKESATAGRKKVTTEPAKRGRPRKVVAEVKVRVGPGDRNLGKRRKSQIDTDWPTVVIDLMEVMTKVAIRQAIGASKHALNDWLRGKRVPSPSSGDALTKFYIERMGRQLPKGKG